MKLTKQLLALALLSAPVLSIAQSPIGGFMQGKNKGNVVLSYNTESYDKVFLVPQKIDGVPVFNKVDIQSASLYATVGLSSKVDIVANIPYIATKGHATDQVLTNYGYTNEKKGIQDLSLYVKYNPFNFKAGTGNINLIGALGIQTPLGNYQVEESLQSIIAIGNKSTQVNSYILAMYKLKCGLFINGQLGYSLRSTAVPDAFLSEVKVGYAAKHFYVDVFSATQISTSGVDILKEGFTGSFPATKVNSTKIGVNLYVPIVKSFGVSGGASSYVDGRNLGQATGYYGAVIYSF